MTGTAGYNTLVNDFNMNESSIALDLSAFSPDAVSPATEAFNENVAQSGAAGPKWWEIGATEYRHRRKTGQTSLPKPIVIERGESYVIPSRDKGRSVPCRLMRPLNASGRIEGVVAYLHGGGWCFGDEDS